MALCVSKVCVTNFLVLCDNHERNCFVHRNQKRLKVTDRGGIRTLVFAHNIYKFLGCSVIVNSETMARYGHTFWPQQSF